MKKYDVIVIGGGFSGTAAAIAAAREGVSVLLVEKHNCLGGAASQCLINPFMKFHIRKKDEQGNVTGTEQLNEGIFEEILSRMRKMGGVDFSDIYNVTFNVEHLKFILENLCEENGVEVLYGTQVISVKVRGGKLRRIRVFNHNGIYDLSARYFVDCTGDAEVAYMSGVPCRLGRDGDQLCQPMTLCFWLSNVNMEKFREERASINPKYKEFQQRGAIKNPRENVLIFHHIAPNTLHFNTTRVTGLNPVDANDVTKAQFIARKQVFEMYGFLKENFSCFKDSVLLMTAPEIGVRESRMIDGDYLYTQDDILSYKKFEDSVACGCYEIDIHNPAGTGTHLIYLDPTKYYTIPYRSLIPKKLKNMLVAGRCISSTHEAQSAYRIMPIVCNIGEGAGIAIACAAKHKTDTRSVDISEVHSIMDRRGARYR